MAIGSPCENGQCLDCLSRPWTRVRHRRVLKRRFRSVCPGGVISLPVSSVKRSCKAQETVQGVSKTMTQMGLFLELEIKNPMPSLTRLRYTYTHETKCTTSF